MSFKHSIMIDARIAIKNSEHGIARHVKELIFNLFKLNSDKKHFYYLLVNNDNILLETNIPENFKLIVLKYGVFSILSQFELFFVISKYKPDLFHSPQFIVPLFSKVPLVATIHDMNHLALGNNYSFLKRLYYQFFLQNKLKKAKAIITVSHFSKNEIVKYFNITSNIIHVFYNGVNQNFKPLKHYSSERIKAVIQKYQLPSQYLFALGNSKPHKNLKKVIESYCLGKYSIPLVILSNSKEQIANFANDFNCAQNVTAIDFVAEDDFPIVYGMSKVFLYVSLYEGFGLPPIEAAACGVPCVVSNSTSLPEVMADSAFYVDPTSVVDIQNGIAKCLESETLHVQEVVKNGLTLIQKYSWEEMAKETRQLYDNLL